VKLDAFFEATSSRLNPIVIKEVRQAVRSRLVIGVFMALLLIFALIALFVSWFVASNLMDLNNYSSGSYPGYYRSRMSGGTVFFLWIYGVLAFATLFFVPAYAGFRIGFERSGQDPDLLFITSLKPGSIIRGKASVAGLLALFFISAGLPFMAFAYLLRGIDIPNMMIIMLLTFAASCAASGLAILTGAIPTRNKVGKVVILLLALYGLFMLAIGAIGMAIAIISEGGIGTFVSGSGATITDVLGFIFIALLLAAAVIWLSHSFASAMIAPPPSNRVLPVRISVSVCFVVISVTFAIFDRIWSTSDGVLVAMIIGVFVFAFGMLLSICERERPGARVAAAIPRNPLGRILAFPFYTGSAGGVLWTLGIGLITILLGVYYWFTDSDGDPLAYAATWMLYFYAYCITALLLRRTLFKNVFRSGHTWLIALILVSLVSLITFFVSDIIFSSMNLNINLPYGNLGKLLAEQDERDHLAFALVWALLMTLVWFPVAFKQMAAFVPPEEEADLRSEILDVESTGASA